MNNKNELAVLILAAGESKRLGETKQLLKYKNKTLTQIAIEKALQLTPNVVVVLGYKAQEILSSIQEYPIQTTVNTNYHQGMGTSISHGINITKKFENTLIMLCDQPFIPMIHYQKMLENLSKSKIIASQYDTYPTVPAIFPKRYYEKLLKLQEDKGAKTILQTNDPLCILLDKKYAVDIDTLKDKNNYLN